ncbi:hypothetical protein V8G54_016961 [Vigna mungo]|uniref:Uncharacterized protein n=1 Tax=Vigna mungo TaxID=3915 RepID=A0AAQ3NM52_VIGMU
MGILGFLVFGTIFATRILVDLICKADAISPVHCHPFPSHVPLLPWNVFLSWSVFQVLVKEKHSIKEGILLYAMDDAKQQPKKVKTLRFKLSTPRRREPPYASVAWLRDIWKFWRRLLEDNTDLLEEMEGGDSRRANAGGTCHCQLRRSSGMGISGGKILVSMAVEGIFLNKDRAVDTKMVDKLKQADRNVEEDTRRVDREMMQGRSVVDREMNVRDGVGKLWEAVGMRPWMLPVGMRVWMPPVGMIQLYGKELQRDVVDRRK